MRRGVRGPMARHEPAGEGLYVGKYRVREPSTSANNVFTVTRGPCTRRLSSGVVRDCPTLWSGHGGTAVGERHPPYRRRDPREHPASGLRGAGALDRGASVVVARI